MENKDSLDLEKVKRQFLEEFRSGKPTLGKDGALASVLKYSLEAALEAEMELHLDSEGQPAQWQSKETGAHL